MKYVLLVLFIGLWVISCDQHGGLNPKTEVIKDSRFKFEVVRDSYSNTTTVITDTKTGIEYLHNDGTNSESMVRLGN